MRPLRRAASVWSSSSVPVEAGSSPSNGIQGGGGEGIRISELLSACVDASDYAARAIVKVKSDVEAGVLDLGLVDKSLGENEAEDPQTIADRLSQYIIVSSLEKQFPGISIVGEEGDLRGERVDLFGESGVLESGEKMLPGKFGLKTNLLQMRGEDILLNANETSIFVDPLDGTKEFTANRLHAVSILIGISSKGRAIGGVMRFPFGEKNNRIYGGKGLGVMGLDPSIPPPVPFNGKDFRAVVSNSRAKGPVQDALDLSRPTSIVNAGGAGYKILKLLDGSADGYVFPRPGMYLWDTGAGEALLGEKGGKLTDRYGNWIDYTPSKLSVSDGLVAATNQELHEYLVKWTNVMDILRTPSGSVFSTDWLEKVLNLNPGDVKSFHVTGDVYRGRHCSLTSLELELQPEAQNVSESPLELIVKRVCPRELPGRPTEKLRRDLESYKAEAGFYQYVAPVLLKEVGIRIPKPYYIHAKGPDDVVNAHENDLLKSEFIIVTESLRKSKQYFELNETLLTSALTTLSKLHAGAYRRDNLLETAGREAWERGGFWTLDKRDPNEIKNMQLSWEKFREKFEHFDEQLFSDSGVRDLGLRIARSAEKIDKKLAEIRKSRSTIIHGDFKTANIFFDEDKSGEATAIDFQWSGVGLGPMDVAYLFLSSAELSVLTDEKKFEGLLQHYHKSLNMDGYLFDDFISDFKLCVLDYARVVIGYMWPSASPERCVARAGELGACTHNRSIPHALWLVKYLHNLLSEYEKESY